MAGLPAAPPSFLLAPRPALERSLKDAIGRGGDPLSSAARYVMGWEDESGAPLDGGGKRVRPLLCLFAATALGGSIEDAMPGAVALELVHNFSLVHDDVQDRDAERHGRPTAWRLVGEPQAINLGDFLYTRAIETLLSGYTPPPRRLAALAALIDATRTMIRGQWLDIEFETRPSVTVDDYVDMVGAKTGALLGASLQVGAVLAGAPEPTARALGRWGVEVGVAFQAHDDHLGAWGDPDLTGKSATNDVARKKRSLPVVLGLQDPVAAPVIRAAYALEPVPAGDVRRVLQALREAGCDRLTADLAAHHAALADDLLHALALPPETIARFREVAAYLISRPS